MTALRFQRLVGWQRRFHEAACGQRRFLAETVSTRPRREADFRRDGAACQSQLSATFGDLRGNPVTARKGRSRPAARRHLNSVRTINAQPVLEKIIADLAAATAAAQGASTRAGAASSRRLGCVRHQRHTATGHQAWLGTQSRGYAARGAGLAVDNALGIRANPDSEAADAPYEWARGWLRRAVRRSAHRQRGRQGISGSIPRDFGAPQAGKGPVSALARARLALHSLD